VAGEPIEIKPEVLRGRNVRRAALDRMEAQPRTADPTP
jgi:hypothetical protein